MACTCGGHNEALFAQLDNVIEQHKDQRGSLISVLHKAQGIFGYLPEEVQAYIAEKMDIPLSEEVVNVNVLGPEEKEFKEYSDITQIVEPIYMVICAEFLGAILLFILIIVYIVRKIIRSESLFEKKRRELLRKYDANIVHIKELPNLKKIDVMFVDNFKDLIDASNTLNLPIHYVDVVIGHEATFIILNKKCAYVYKLSDKDLRD